MQTFVVKLASGVAALIASICLQICNLSNDTTDTAAVATAAASSVVGLRMTMTILPMICLLCGIFIFHKKVYSDGGEGCRDRRAGQRKGILNDKSGRTYFLCSRRHTRHTVSGEWRQDIWNICITEDATLPEHRRSVMLLVEKATFAPGNTNLCDGEHPAFSLEDMRLEMSSYGKGTSANRLWRSCTRTAVPLRTSAMKVMRSRKRRPETENGDLRELTMRRGGAAS